MLNFNVKGMNSILFKIAHDNLNTFYDELFNLEDLIIFAYGTSLDVTDVTAFLESLKNFQRKNPNFLTDIIHRECQYLQKIS